MRQQPIHPLGELATTRPGVGRDRHDRRGQRTRPAAHDGMGRPGRRHTRRRHGRRPVRRQVVVQRAAQVVHTDAARRHHLHDRRAQSRGQHANLHGQAASRRHVHHVQADDDPRVRGNQFADQHEIAGQVRGIDDDDDRVVAAPRLIDRVAHDARFRRVQRQVVDAGEVQHLDGPVGQRQRPGAHRRRGARKVGCLGARPAQAIEQRRLAGVGIPDQDHPAAGAGRSGRR